MFTMEFWKAALERAIKTFAQVAILVILGGKMLAEDTPVNVFEVDWMTVLGFGLGGFILSLLFSIVSSFVGEKGAPSLTKAEVLAPEEPIA